MPSRSGLCHDTKSEIRARAPDGAEVRDTMESSYSIQPAENLVRMQVSGEITVAELKGLINRVGEDPHYHPGMNAIADLRRSSGQWDYSEIQRFRDYLVHIAQRRQCRWAALVKPGAVVAIGYVVILICEGVSIEMQMFEDPQAALRWVQGERR